MAYLDTVLEIVSNRLIINEFYLLINDIVYLIL